MANRDIANQDVRQPVAKKIAKAVGAEDFNVLQNNGRIAHQVVDHVSFNRALIMVKVLTSPL